MTEPMERNPNLLGAEQAPDFRIESGEAPRFEATPSSEQAKPLDLSPSAPTAEIPSQTVETPSQTVEPDRLLKSIETAMTKGRMMKVYEALSPEEQQAFRTKGEETAQQLRALIGVADIYGGQALRLIRDWMYSLRGKDRAFLEQEAIIVFKRLALLEKDQRDSSVAM